MSEQTMLLRERSKAVEDEQQEEPNNYCYPEFAGWSGERYLKKVLRQILPMALYRTWGIFVEYQGRGNDCYLSVSQLAICAGRTLRTMQKDLATLGARQLLIERAVRKRFCGPDRIVKSRVVVVKDFSNLYALAHEYHEWLHAADYVAPDRALSAFVRQNAHLLAKVRRFENYRRVLYHQRPGPQPQMQEEEHWFTDFQVETVSPSKEERAVQADRYPKTGRQAKNSLSTELFKDLSKDSPKRINKLPPSENTKREIFDSASLSSERTEKQSQARAVQRSGQRVSSEPDQSDGSTSAPGQALACSFVQEISVPFGDLNLKGSLTRALTIIANTPLETPADVLLCLVRAYTIARDTGKVRPEHWNSQTGRANRMPLFCTMFQRLAQARAQSQQWGQTWQQMEEEITADALLAGWRSKHQVLWSKLAEHHPDEQEDVQRTPSFFSPESAQKEIESSVVQTLPQKPYLPRLSQKEEEREERATFARHVLARLTNMAVVIHEPIVWWEHIVCGCPLYHKRAGKEICALCFPDPTWSEEVRTLIHSIVETRCRAKDALDGTEAAGAKRYDATIPGKRGGGQATCLWTEREDAYACGVHLLEALASCGYTAEMNVRSKEERYQVILRSEGYEVALDTPEHVQLVLEQVSRSALEGASQQSEGRVTDGASEQA